MKLTFVIPICRHTHSKCNELERFKNIGLVSFHKYLDPEVVHEFLIISPKDQLLLIKNELAPIIGYPVRFISDESLLGKATKMTVDSWYKQQLIKLAVATAVQTEHYMTIDTDIFLTRRLHAKDIFRRGGKLLMTLDRYHQHTGWWERSRAQLQLSKSVFRGNEWVIQVTPQVLITKKVIDLLTHLEGLWGTEWREHLLEHKFTEYTLYWTYLKVYGGIEKYRVRPGLSLMGNGLWYEAQPVANQTKLEALEAHVKNAFTNNAKYFFSLVQSNINGYTLQEILPIVQKYL